MDIESIFKKADLRIRKSQIDMINEIKKATINKKKLVIEAGTGVGKTLAYLIGVYLGQRDAKKKKQIIISTNTIALQEQLIKKDLPSFPKLIEEKISFVIAKGRGRYICHRRLANLNSESKINVSTIDYLEQQLNTGWNGDFDLLKRKLVKDDLIQVCNTASTCVRKRCEFWNDCSFIKARNRIRSSDIIVVNHSLLLSHLSFGDGSILPEYDKSIFIIDECHNFPDKALSAFSGQLSFLGSQKWINDVDKTLNLLPKGIVSHIDLKELQIHKKNIIRSLAEAYQIIQELYKSNKPRRDNNENIFLLKEVPKTLLDLEPIVRSSALNYQSIIKRAKKKLDEFVDKSNIHTKDSLTKHFSALSFYYERVGNLIYVWEMLVCNTKPPIAKWIKLNLDYKESPDYILENLGSVGDKQYDYTLFVSASVAGGLLEKLFWSQVKNSIIFCSATVRSLGSFSKFISDMGLDNKTIYAHFSSPFDYGASKLVVPKLTYPPQRTFEHIQETSEIILPKLLVSKKLKKGVLVLFTSIKAMQSVFMNMPKEVQEYILMQGDVAKSSIIMSHKRMIDYGKSSIIFGVDSFAEGIDLPGKYLELLIIHKLPFTVPSNPITKTRTDWISENGKNAFVEELLPEASIKLTQMVGRLVRDESDSGEIIILDNRLVTKVYGKKLLDNLPPFEFKV